jgi:hypothetical protein
VNAAIQAIVDENNKVPACESCHEHTSRLLQHAVGLTLVFLLSASTLASSNNAFLVTRFPPDATTGVFLIGQDRKLNTAVECITTGMKARPGSSGNARRDGQVTLSSKQAIKF